MDKSNTINKAIFEKLLAIQKEIEPIVKSDTNPFFKSRYFDINTLLGVLKPILSKHELVLTQGLGETFLGKPALVTVIRCNDETEKYTLPIPEIADPQKFGSVVSYYRRYAIQSLFALESIDDDGNTASGKVAEQEKHEAVSSGRVVQSAKPVVKPKAPVTQDDNDVPWN